MTLNIRNMCKSFGSLRVFHNLNVSIHQVKSVVFLGPSGGGKTTLLRILGGVEKPDSGEITLNGRVIDYHDENLREYRKRVGMVFQNYNLFPHMTALENITVPLIKIHGVQKDHAISQAEELLSRFELITHKDKKPSQLSGGQKQRVAISRALSIQPEVLFLDEPTSSLDPEYTAEVLDIIREVEDDGIETILVTHEMGFARVAAEEVLFVGDGGVIAQGSPKDIFENPCDPRVAKFFDRVLKY